MADRLFLIRVIYKLLSRPFHKIDMTLGQGRKPMGTGKKGHIKVVFLLGKSVFRGCHSLLLTYLRDFMYFRKTEQTLS